MSKLRPLNALDKLELVLALAREQHFGRAAESCGITQPTLSAGLKALEDALGILIVRRSSRFQGFTPEGERVLGWARRIVGDAEALRQDVEAMKRGLDGHLRLAVIPTALPMVVRLTTPFRAAHPGVRFTVLSRTSDGIRQMVENLEVDAGVSYLDNEPLGHVRAVPIYAEGYRLLTAADGPFGRRATVTWVEAGSLPLCLLPPDMQNRRIIDATLAEAGATAEPTLVSDSILVLISHVRSGRWSSILPPILADSVGLPPEVVAIPVVAPELTHAVGLVVPQRDVAAPLVTALLRTAQNLARELAAGTPSI